MSRKEFEDRLEELQEKVEIWDIVVGYEALADFRIGCFFDNDIGKWKVYENLERGRQCVYLETPNEEEAFDELFTLVNFRIEVSK